MLIKAGVDISRLNPEIRRTLTGLKAYMEAYNKELVITSTSEGDHMAGSKHYCNDAYDVRRPAVLDLKDKVRIAKVLGPRFDVVFYEKTIHVEYKLKKGMALNVRGELGLGN